MMTMPSVEDMLRGMPHSQRGRGRTLYERGREDATLRAVEEVRLITDGKDNEPVTLEAVRAWLRATSETVERERQERGHG